MLRNITYATLGLLTVLGVSATSLTTNVLAQNPNEPAAVTRIQNGLAAKALPKATERTGTPKEVLELKRRDALIAKGILPPLPEGPFTSISRGDETVSVRENSVKVSARHKVLTTVPGNTIQWTLRLYGESIEHEPLSETLYREKGTEVPVKSLFSPSFTETLRLEPGVYHVEVLFQVIAPGADVAKFPNVEKKANGLAFSHLEKVTIK